MSDTINIGRVRTSALLLLAAIAALGRISEPKSAYAQDSASRIAGYSQTHLVLTKGLIVTSPGAEPEKLNIRIRNGLIEEIGSFQPDEATPTLNIDGHHVYAGFIDTANGSLLDSEVKPPESSERKVDFTRYVLAATRPDNHRLMTPQFQASGAIKTSSDELNKLRSSGFTTANVMPSGRIFSGTGALISLDDKPLRESLLLRSTWSGLRIYAPGSSLYPSTTMGSMAHVRQHLLDARRHHHHHVLFKTGQTTRPPVDPVLESLNGVLNGSTTVMLRAGGKDSLHRGLDICEEFQIRPTVFVAATNDRTVLERITAIGRPVVVELDMGDQPEVEIEEAADKLQVETKDPVRVQEDRVEQWKHKFEGLKQLEASGVPFAFASSGVDSPKALLKAVRAAVEQGLSAKAALTALTQTPAEMLGQSRHVGTLEPGKLAHLVVFSGPFEAPDSKVRFTFIGNEKHEFNKPKDEDSDDESKDEDDSSGDPKDADDDKVDKKDTKGSDAAESDSARNDSNTGDNNTGDNEKSDSGKKVKKRKAGPQLPTELESDRILAPVTGGNILIRNATIMDGVGRTWKNASVLVQNGRIRGIGRNLEAPEGTYELDATGMHVIPGIVDTHSHIMITGGTNEYSQSIVPEVRVADVVNSEDVKEYRALAGGVTIARLLHGSANVIGGQDAVVKLRIGETAADHLFDGRHIGVKFALGENVKYRETRFPNTRLGVEATLNRAFLEAIDYRRRQMQARNAEPGQVPPRRDLRLEALADIVNHEKFIHSHCYRADEILMLLRVASNLGIRVWSLQHVLEGYKIAPEIVEHGASCSTFSDWWAYKVEAYDATPYNAALLHEAGANVVIKSDDAELIRHMYLEASKTIRYGGLTEHQALQTITLNSARELGIDDRVGSIEVGKDGDFAIFNGHPFFEHSRCEFTIIDGEIRFRRDAVPTAMTARGLKLTPSTAPARGSRRRARKLRLNKSANGVYAIVGADLYPVDAGPIPQGKLVIRDGLIEAIGKDIEVPDDAQVIRADGLRVYPGLIDSGTTLGLTEVGRVDATTDFSESGGLQPDLRAGVAINPDSELFPVARAGGICTALARPTGGTIAGQASIIQLAGWTAPQMVMNLEAALQINWPRSADSRQLKELKEFLALGREYIRLIDSAKANGTLGPVPDPRLEALRPYLAGERRVIIEADRRGQIAEALLFAEEEKLDIVIAGGGDAWKLANELKRRKVPVIVGPVMARPESSHDPFDAPYANPGRLHEAGVSFCIRSDDASNSRNAPFEAGMAVAYGLPEEVGIRSVTLSAAEILGIEKELGSLTAGKRATLVITDRSPLIVAGKVEGIFIDGQPFAPESKHTRMYERYRERVRNMKLKAEKTTTTGQ